MPVADDTTERTLEDGLRFIEEGLMSDGGEALEAIRYQMTIWLNWLLAACVACFTLSGALSSIEEVVFT